jgi:hypothetical protein
MLFMSNAVQTMATRSKHQQEESVAFALFLNPAATSMQIADALDCSEWLVNQIRARIVGDGK